ncbi:MAG: N-acyl homoserine lactonase family protein [Bacteroidetes bacterium]|nr:N-acyl homoserine lactonase family protein [Bacteroidota bacterium]MCH8524352.1 N-acyl homoserine lactonase family protein [Balneolales bacterium]
MKMKSCIAAIAMVAVGLSMAAPAQAQSPEGMKLYITSSGELNLDQGWLTAMTNHGNRIDIPVPMYIIDHPDGLVVFDTGMNIAVVPDNGAEYWGPVAGAFTPTMSREQGIDRQLNRIGKSVEDVRYVVHSHLHLDHAGNISMFPNATHIIRKAELQNAWWPERFQRAAYVMDDFKSTYQLNIIELTRDLDLFGDGSVELIDTKGHTKGHQSMIVRLPNSGTMILASDAAYMAENLQGTVPGIVWNVEYAMDAIERMKLIRDIEGGKIILSHSMEMYNTLRHLPQYYD